MAAAAGAAVGSQSQCGGMDGAAFGPGLAWLPLASKTGIELGMFFT